MKNSVCVSSFSLGRALARGWESFHKWQKAAGHNKPLTMKVLCALHTNQQMRVSGQSHAN